jgi:glycosyltransferase involved in cell wall biosynthesis
MIGMRGLPADLPMGAGGERETEAQAVRLAQRGHDITVYCRWEYNRHPQTPYRGVRLISLPAIATKNLGTMSHSLLATLHTIIFNTADIVNFHGMGNGLYIPLLRLSGKRCLMNMGGVDWERPKWSALARLILRIGAWLSFQLADTVVVDNPASQARFEKDFHRKAHLITLGAERWEDPGASFLAQRDLQQNRYLLFVGRLIPDKSVDVLIRAYRSVKTHVPLVIVGDNWEGPRYVNGLKQLADDRVRFLGWVYGDEVRQLFANCFLYVQPSAMEGNSPSILSAMGCGRCAVVSDIEQNLETIGNAGLSFRRGEPQDLAKVIQGLLSDPDRVSTLGREAKARVDKMFNWDNKVNEVESIYLQYGHVDPRQ